MAGKKDKFNSSRTLCEICNDDGEVEGLCRLCKTVVEARMKANGVDVLVEEVALENRRQDGKKFVGPAVLMEIFGHQLKIGSEKGYTDGSWKRYIDDNEDVLPSLKRHLIEVEKGINDGWYNEYKPDGDICQTEANHAYALMWNACVLAMQVYNRRNKK